jgi:hypothetical protein
VAVALDRLKEALERDAGGNRAGLILYGGLARGRFRPGSSDVNVVVLLHDASAASLHAIAPALQAAWRAAGVEPLLLTPGEVPGAAEAFPTKFLDIQDHHVVLAGANPFASLTVSREQVRLRTEQELRNLLLRLRQRYVAASDEDASLTRALARAARPFALGLAALLRLAGRDVPIEDRTAAIFAAAAAAFDLDGQSLARLAELRQDSQPASDAASLYRRVLGVIGKAVDLADRMRSQTHEPA